MCCWNCMFVQMLKVNLHKIYYLFTLLYLKLEQSSCWLAKTNQQIKNIYIHTMNKIKHKYKNLKITLQTTKTLHVWHVEKVHAKFLLCFNSSLNSCKKLDFFNFISRLFHKVLSMIFNEFIPYFWKESFFQITFGIEREIPFLRDIFLIICFPHETSFKAYF